MTQKLEAKDTCSKFETVKLSTITTSDITRMNLISDKNYVSERMPNVTPPIKVNTKLRDIYQFKGSNIYVNDNSSFICKRPSICKVRSVVN